MFLEHGYERTNVNELVRRTGGSMATLYRYYGGKAGLFAAMMDEVRKELLTPLTELGSAREDPEVFLTRLAEAFLRLAVSPDGIGFFRVLVAEAYKFPELQHAVARGFGQLTGHLASYLATQTAEGRLQLRDPERAAAQFLEMVKGQAQLLAVMGLGQPMSDREVSVQVGSAVSLFLHGCTATPRAPAAQTRKQ
jgi:AcrR family transcriptional regulator